MEFITGRIIKIIPRGNRTDILVRNDRGEEEWINTYDEIPLRNEGKLIGIWLDVTKSGWIIAKGPTFLSPGKIAEIMMAKI